MKPIQLFEQVGFLFSYLIALPKNGSWSMLVFREFSYQFRRLCHSCLPIGFFLSFFLVGPVILLFAFCIKNFGGVSDVSPELLYTVLVEFLPFLVNVLIIFKIGSLVVADVATKSHDNEFHTLESLGISVFQYYVIPVLSSFVIISILLYLIFVVGGYFTVYLVSHIFGSNIISETMLMKSFVEDIRVPVIVIGFIQLLVPSMMTGVCCILQPLLRYTNKQDESILGNALQQGLSYSLFWLLLTTIMGTGFLLTLIEW